MKAVIQRVIHAKVTIAGKETSQIDTGFLVFLGISRTDTEKTAEKLAQKIAKLRVMNDANAKMNQTLSHVGGEVLVVSQFTLYADTTKGNRPSFIQAAEPKKAKRLYDYFTDTLRKTSLTVKTGVFGAMMNVTLTNDGPVTVLLTEEE